MALLKHQRGFWNFVIPAVASVAGALLNKKSNENAAESAAQATTDANTANLQLTREMNDANLAAQKEFAQHGVSWRVQDAKEAGLHPLFGAGLTGATFSPSFTASDVRPVPTAPPQDFSFLGQLGQLMGQFVNQPQARAAQVAAAREAQGEPQSVTITEYPGGGRSIAYPIRGLESQVSGVPLYSDPADISIGGVYSPLQKSDPLAKLHVVETPDRAGAFWQRFNFDDRFQVLLPKTSEPQEVFEDKPLWFWAMVAKANVKEYGPGWLTTARRQFPSLREVWDGVIQELRSSGILDSVSGAVPDLFRR